MMRNIINSLIFTLMFVLMANPSYGDELVMKSKTSQFTGYQTNPNNLLDLGYQGYFNNQGIPSSGLFIHQVNTGEIIAKKLVQIGIDNGRLSADKINDDNYINYVDSYLQHFDNGN